MKLYKMTVDHHGGDDSNESILGWAIADNERQVFSRLWTEDQIEEWSDKQARLFIQYSEPGIRAELARVPFGLEVDENEASFSVSGPYLSVLMWARRDPVETYEGFERQYGYNIYGWEEGVNIAKEDAEALLRLGVAEDLRRGAGDE